MKMDEGEEDLLLRCLLELSGTKSADDDDNNGDPAILSAILSPHDIWGILTTNNNKHGLEAAAATARDKNHESTIHQSPWLEKLSRASNLAHRLSTFDLHASASDALNLGSNDDNNVPIDVGRERQHASFATVCLLLCCFALNKHKEDVSLIERRPKRWQSLVWETIRLFQSKIRTSKDADRTGQILELVWIPLWVNYVVPCTHDLQQHLLAQSVSNKATYHLSIACAYHVGLVATTTLLARLLGVGPPHNPTKQSKSHCTRLLESLLQNLPANWDQVLLYHPYRRLHADTMPSMSSPDAFRSMQAALFYWTLAAPGTESEDVDRKESISWMETQWDDVGLAALAAVAFEQQQRPLVWSAAHCWRLWLPQVSVLLNAEDTKMESDDSTNEEWDCSWFLWMGYGLLEQLLPCIPNGSLTVPNRLLISTASSPENPLGTLQLLSNRIVAAAMESRQSAASQPPSNSGGTMQLPNESVTFQIMQRLLSKYVPRHQVVIVRQLVEECPHPGLRPKLLDLLRPFVQWEPPDVATVWVYCNSILQDLEAHTSHDSRTHSPFLINVDELDNTAELHCSCISLLYLWIRIRRTTPSILNVIPRLSNIHATIHAHNVRCSEGLKSNSSNHRSRLLLLESMLQQILDHAQY